MKTKSCVSAGILTSIVLLCIYSHRGSSVPILECVRKENGGEVCTFISSASKPKFALQDEADESENTGTIPFHDENSIETNEPKDKESVEQEKVATTIENTTSEKEKGDESLLKEEQECHDKYNNCETLAYEGECDQNPSFMHENCTKTCNTCADRPLEAILAYGEAQEVEGSGAAQTFQVVKSTLAYMKTVERKYSSDVLEQCKNQDALCAFWAGYGECENSSAYMARSCGPSCQTCHLFEDSQERCLLLDADKTPALKPGDLDRLMKHIVDNSNLTTKVYSRPGKWMGPSHIQPPWLISIDNFLTTDECALVRDKATTIGFEASTLYNGHLTESRQSQTSWCTHENQCRNEEPMQGIMQRISDLLLIPTQNFENFQIVKYERGQYYSDHHDAIKAHFDKPYGPRILSFMVYLNDVEDAGETNFPDLDVLFKPKLGKALFWPNVLNENLLEKDVRMDVNELPVGEGQKLTLHSFIHLYNYIDVKINGCNES